MFEPRASDLDLVDVENALLRGAFGDYADEAAILLLINFGHWLPQLQSADLITVAPEVDGEGRWAQIAWPDLEPALSTGLIVGSSGEVRVLRAAASIADGRPIDLGDLAAGLDRRALTLLLAAIAHAAGSHDHRRLTYDGDGIARPGDRLPPLVAWPLRE
ncbi:MAG: hypothetical protein ACJ786_37400 [Catenulispora sp.]